jgi:hypothetical protein
VVRTQVVSTVFILFSLSLIVFESTVHADRLATAYPTELRNRPTNGNQTSPADTTGVDGKETPSDTPSRIKPPLRDFKPDPDTPMALPELRSSDVEPDTDPADTEPAGRAAHGPGSRRTYQFGLQYPGVALGIRREDFSIELKALHDEDITILGARVYQHSVYFDRTNLYWVMDGSTVQFEGDVSSGEGISMGLAGGIEHFLGPQLSWKVDVGPYYTFLEDESTGIDAGGLEFVVTTGLTLHVN